MVAKRSLAEVFEPVLGERGFRDLDPVRLMTEVPAADGEAMPAGSLGTIVHRYIDGAAYEVEFTLPHHALLTLEGRQIAAV